MRRGHAGTDNPNLLDSTSEAEVDGLLRRMGVDPEAMAAAYRGPRTEQFERILCLLHENPGLVPLLPRCLADRMLEYLGAVSGMLD